MEEGDDMKITLLGLGEIGTANRDYFTSLGHSVSAYDPPKGLNEFADADLYIICTSSSEIEKVIALLPPDAMVSIESTITEIGMTDRLAQEHRFLCYCPQRYWRDDPEHRGVVRYRLIASTPSHLASFRSIYGLELLIPTLPVSSTVAEYSKLVENAYRGLQIAFAQELKMLVGDDFDAIREAVMTNTPMHWMAEAREGIGGECLPMAMRTLRHLSLIEQAIQSDAEYRRWLAR